MLVKTRFAFALALTCALTSTAARAVDSLGHETTALTVAGPALVVVETSGHNAPKLRTPPAEKTSRPVVLEASLSHLVLVVTQPGALWIDHAGGELTVSITHVKVHEGVRLEAGSGAHRPAT